MNASLDLDGLEIIQDVFFLIEDLATGVIPFDTDTKVNGELGLFFFKIPIEVSSFFSVRFLSFQRVCFFVLNVDLFYLIVS